MHETAIDKHIGTGIDIDGIRRGSPARGIRCPDILRRCEDIAVEVAHMVALIDMVRPERRVDKTDILDGDIPGVGHVGEAWALGILIGALRIPLPANPELLPITESVAVDGAMTSDGEAIQAVGIDKRTEILAGLTLDTGGENGADPFSLPTTCRCVPCLKKRAPVRKVPSGMTTTPPPSRPTRSMTCWMASVCTTVESVFTPKSVITYWRPSAETSTFVVSWNQASITVPSGHTSVTAFFRERAAPVMTSSDINSSINFLIFLSV